MDSPLPLNFNHTSTFADSILIHSVSFIIIFIGIPITTIAAVGTLGIHQFSVTRFLQKWFIVRKLVTLSDTEGNFDVLPSYHPYQTRTLLTNLRGYKFLSHVNFALFNQTLLWLRFCFPQWIPPLELVIVLGITKP